MIRTVTFRLCHFYQKQIIFLKAVLSHPLSLRVLLREEAGPRQDQAAPLLGRETEMEPARSRGQAEELLSPEVKGLVSL